MKIGVDGRALGSEAESGLRQPRGIARYASSLLSALVARHPEHEWRVLLPRGARTPALDGVRFRRPRAPARAVHASAALTGRPRLDRLLGGDLDVVWLPAPAPVAVSPRVPYVLTVHDLSSEIRAEDFGAYARLWIRVARPRRLALRAAGVMTVSSDTRDEVVTRWGLSPERVTIVRPGVWRPVAPLDESEVSLVRRRLSLPERYLLYVGALEPRKGLDVLLRAFESARSRGLDAGLALVGDGPLRDGLSAPGVVLPGRVSDSDLAALYAGARATVLPSLLEGFGFTPLESLAAGTPAVVSDLPALRETMGEGALFVPPGDAAALADALLAVDRDQQLRRRLLDTGRAAVARLSWESAADEAHALLRRAAAA